MFGLYIAGAVIYFICIIATSALGTVRGGAQVIMLMISSLVEFLLVWGIFHS